MDTVTLTCDWDKACTSEVTHLDEKGFAYCTAHGNIRKEYMRCRKLRPAELKKLRNGQQLERY